MLVTIINYFCFFVVDADTTGDITSSRLSLGQASIVKY